MRMKHFWSQAVANGLNYLLKLAVLQVKERRGSIPVMKVMHTNSRPVFILFVKN